MKENEYQLVMRLKVKKFKEIVSPGSLVSSKVEKTHTQYIMN